MYCPECTTNVNRVAEKVEETVSNVVNSATEFVATATDVVNSMTTSNTTQEPPPESQGSESQPAPHDYTVMWDKPDTSKERVGLALAGGLAFLAPFVGFAVAANVARGGKGYLKPVGAGALTFFAMRAAAVGVLHFSGNLPSVSTPAALGALLPQVPRRHYVRPTRSFGSPCRSCR